MRKLYNHIFYSAKIFNAINVFFCHLLYDLTMNFAEKRILFFRFLASFLILISSGLMIAAFVGVYILQPEDTILTYIGLGLTFIFSIFEIVIIMRGWRKESNLQKICFTEIERVNTVPLFAVGIGTAFGIGLTVLGTVVFFVRDDPTIKGAMLVVAPIGFYLLINCIIYFIYLIMFRKRELNLKDLIK